MYKVLLFLLFVLNASFVFGGYFVEKYKSKRIKVVLYICFSFLNPLLLTYGQQAGYLFGGGASDNWVIDPLLPLCCYFLVVGGVMWYASSKLSLVCQTFPSYLLCFLFVLFLVFFFTMIVLISLFTS